MLRVNNTQDAKVYSLSDGVQLPDWVQRNNRAALKKDAAWARRIELLQDFSFPEASLRIRPTRDGQHIIATGVYKPQMRVYDLAQLALKFERHTDCDNVQFEILSDDWTKSVHLQSDRTVEFHSQFGLHHKTRVPKFGRDLRYHYPSCDLYVCGASDDVWRLNCEQGRFLPPLRTQFDSVNTLALSPAHNLIALASGSSGEIQFHDPRTRARLAVLSVHDAEEITAVSFKSDGLTMGAGTADGRVLVYDLRHSSPLAEKDHYYGEAIRSILWHETRDWCISADKKIIKVWEYQNEAKQVTSIEPPSDINDVCIYPSSGLVMVANEGVPIQSYYIPALGPAPKWCPFIDNLTEELEEAPQETVYEDFKFVTRRELESLALDHLVGTNMLRAYMHGFFIDLRLYQKAFALSQPFKYAAYRDAEVEKRLAPEKRVVAGAGAAEKKRVNDEMAARLAVSKKKGKNDGDDQIDARFKSMFEDDEFAVNQDSDEFKLRYPSGLNLAETKSSAKKKQRLRMFEQAMQESSSDGEEEDGAGEEQEKDKPRFYQFKDHHALSQHFSDLKSRNNNSRTKGNGDDGSEDEAVATFEAKVRRSRKQK